MSSTALPPVPGPTQRLVFRHPHDEHAAFFLSLLNDPLFVRFTGDRGIRDLAGARGYIAKLAAHRQRWGYGLDVIVLRATDEPIGACGFVRRAELDAPDIGFGFLAAHHRQGYGFEAAAATMHHGRTTLALDLILGITQPDNTASIRLLEKLGLRLTESRTLPGLARPQFVYSTDPTRLSPNR
ncbi:GNAT family N-acetyltransferase [Synoicihabitans lomoniglobus]|uniref:GNAT family N-acetyltransferase n=1 Tax=Synoicihabitans lomoniglobus TaxID=2909285 RepID=A0AAF0CNW1_9BACT|nr:GNAT family N-acetyltransferase [Opitutaceae bacterium LMO-M01]WED62989.1 GNAT family N-acetyltransferase [Opitutaceae bacterium LMO-M01]